MWKVHLYLHIDLFFINFLIINVLILQKFNIIENENSCERYHMKFYCIGTFKISAIL